MTQRTVIDLTGEVCPYPFVRAMLALEDMAPGDELELVVDYPPAVQSVTRSLVIYGHTVVATTPAGEDCWRMVIRKGAATSW